MQITPNTLIKYNEIHNQLYGFYLGEAELLEQAQQVLQLVKLSIEKPADTGSSTNHNNQYE